MDENDKPFWYWPIRPWRWNWLTVVLTCIVLFLVQCWMIALAVFTWNELDPSELP